MRKLLSLGMVLGVGLLTALANGCSGGSDDDHANKTGPGTVNTAGDGPKRIVLLDNGPSPFWDAARAGMNEAVTDLQLEKAGLQAVFQDNDGTAQGQLDKLRQLSSQDDVVALAVSAIDAKNAAIADQLRALQAKGVKVVTFDSDLDRKAFRDARSAFIGTDNYMGGVELGVCAKKLRPKGGGYVTFVGRTGAQNAIDRVEGFKKGAGKAFHSIDNMGDLNDRTRARQNVRDAITNHPDDLKVLVGIWSYNAPAIADVVKQLDRRKDFTVVTFDAEPLAIKYLGDGMIDAMIVQNPYQMGYQAVRLLKAMVKDDQATVKKMLPKHGEPEGDIYDTGLKVVVPDKGSPLKADMFQKNTEFYPLSKFRAWLDKYHLTQS